MIRVNENMLNTAERILIPIAPNRYPTYGAVKRFNIFQNSFISVPVRPRRAIQPSKIMLFLIFYSILSSQWYISMILLRMTG